MKNVAILQLEKSLELLRYIDVQTFFLLNVEKVGFFFLI